MKHEAWRLLVSAYQDGELNPGDRARVEAHLAECTECRQVLTDYRQIGDALRHLPRREPSRELWHRVRGALPSRRPVRPLWVRLLPVASAAVLLLVAVTLFLYQGAGLGFVGAPRRELAAPPGPTAEAGKGSPVPVPLAAPQPTSAPEQPDLGRAYVAKAGCPGEVLAVEMAELAKRSDEALPSPHLEGVLYDATGRPLVGVTLVLTGTSGWLGSAVTGPDGRFAFVLPAPGRYRIALALATAHAIATEDSGSQPPAEQLEAALGACPPAGPPLPLVAVDAHEVAILSLRASRY
ncbi:MAG: zf-HC2 domain-containing protein [Chloroflexia bacterium]